MTFLIEKASKKKNTNMVLSFFSMLTADRIFNPSLAFFVNSVITQGDIKSEELGKIVKL